MSKFLAKPQQTNPGISVIMPCYKDGAFIEETLSSIMAHNAEHVPLEVIIVDDGSPDEKTKAALDRIEAHKDNMPYPVTVVRLEKNTGGPATPRNEAIARAKHDYICPIDADDKLNNDPALLKKGSYFSRALDMFEKNPDQALVVSQMQPFSAKDGFLPKCPFGAAPYSEKAMLLQGSIPAFAVFRKEDVPAKGAYDPGVKSCEDWVCFLGILNNRLEQGKGLDVTKMPEDYLLYRQHDKDAERDTIHERNAARETETPEQIAAQRKAAHENLFAHAVRAAPSLYQKHLPDLDLSNPVPALMALANPPDRPNYRAALFDPDPANVKWHAGWNAYEAATYPGAKLDADLQEMAKQGSGITPKSQPKSGSSPQP